ncbi:unannotated protein [freshwater metagenome]|uniref:Unannotated protein n=1 Tax=freshwater metagenome TaxID=449393 RepID=A0A6J7ANH1_9ZZZZ
MAAGVSVPSGWRPNISVPISQPRMPPCRYSAVANAWPGYCSGGMCDNSDRASRYTAWPPAGRTTGTPAADSASAK